MPHQPRQRAAHRAGYQQHGRFVLGLLAVDAFGQALVQAFGQAGFERGAAALDGILQDPFQLRRQRVDGQFVGVAGQVVTQGALRSGTVSDAERDEIQRFLEETRDE